MHESDAESRVLNEIQGLLDYYGVDEEIDENQEKDPNAIIIGGQFVDFEIISPISCSFFESPLDSGSNISSDEAKELADRILVLRHRVLTNMYNTAFLNPFVWYHISGNYNLDLNNLEILSDGNQQAAASNLSREAFFLNDEGDELVGDQAELGFLRFQKSLLAGLYIPTTIAGVSVGFGVRNDFSYSLGVLYSTDEGTDRVDPIEFAPLNKMDYNEHRIAHWCLSKFDDIYFGDRLS